MHRSPSPTPRPIGRPRPSTRSGLGPARPSGRPLTAALLAVGLVAGLLLSAGHAAAERPRVFALTGADVIIRPGNTVEDATVVIRDGLIEAVGADVSVPADAVAVDAEGLTVWAGWIDGFSTLSLKERREDEAGGNFIQQILQELVSGPEQEVGTGHPIELVHPGYSVTEELVSGDRKVERHRELGFTAALVAPRDGIYRGTSALIVLRDAGPRELVVAAPIAQHVAYDSGQFLGPFPGSLMGAITTIRQVLLDAERYATWRRVYEENPAGTRRPEFVDAYPALQPAVDGDRPVLFHDDDNLAVERSLRIAEEFGLRPVLLGTGREYEILGLLEGREAPVIVPVAYPDEPDVEDPGEALEVDLEEMERWHRAPGNAAALERAGVTFAFTTRGLKNVADFTANVRKAIEAGLSEETALAAVTSVPAGVFGVDDVLGTVEAGKIANLVVATGPPFAEESEIRHVFVDGVHHEYEEEEQVGDPTAEVDPRGTWAVTFEAGPMTRTSTWTITGEPGDWEGSVESDRGTTEFTSVTLEGNALTVVMPGPMGEMELTVVIEGDEFEGAGELPNGMTFSVSGTRTAGPEAGLRVAGGGGR